MTPFFPVSLSSSTCINTCALARRKLNAGINSRGDDRSRKKEEFVPREMLFLVSLSTFHSVIKSRCLLITTFSLIPWIIWKII